MRSTFELCPLAVNRITVTKSDCCPEIPTNSLTLIGYLAVPNIYRGGAIPGSRLPTCRASAPESARSAIDHLKPVRGTGICRWLFGPALGSPKTCQIRTQSNCVAVATEFGVPESQGFGGIAAAPAPFSFQRVVKLRAEGLPLQFEGGT